ncbi:hypothetical protein [Streptomyces osmaniensis]|uniref:Secreted protein n=1 Tax=Streptomyces osmaniensis TaxID=593134 RepID=A0ABP6Y2X6_9ACTN
MAGSSSSIVAGLTTAALATVGFLAFRASATVPADLAGSRSGNVAGVSASKVPRDREDPDALPDGSGTGQRVVYSVDDDRVWLVAAGGKVKRTFRVYPGSVDPPTGVYAVTSRSNAATGTDGASIEHVIRFASVDTVTIGFSTTVRSPSTHPDPAPETGGIRESRADGDAMWDFATIGRAVVVIR